MSWFRRRTKATVDVKVNKNKQSAKGGNIRNSTFEINSGDATQAIILQEVLKLGDKVDNLGTAFDELHKTVDKLEIKSNNIHKAFNLYVQNNGVKPEVKAEVKKILEQ